MNKVIAVLAAVVMQVQIFAQTNPEKYAATITPQSLKQQLTIIAGAEMEGRETATEGQRKAAAYIAEQFKQAGLLPAPGTTNYQQEFQLFYDSLVNATLVVNGKTYELGKDFVATLGTNENGTVKSNQLVFGGYGISDSAYDDYAGKKVKGKIVIVFSGEPKKGDNYIVSGTTRATKWTYQGNYYKAVAAKQKGARAVLVINTSSPTFRPELLASLRTSNVYYPRSEITTPDNADLVTLSHEAAAGLLGKATFDGLLASAKNNQSLDTSIVLKTKVRFDFFKQKVPQFSTNVVGYIEGTDKKDEYVVLTSHYDHLGKRGEVIYYGADDDGSGTSSVVDMAHAFGKAKAEGNGPRRTIVFMTVSGEEKGLLGSQYYSENPLFPLDKTSVDLNIDMVGRIDPSRKEGDSTNYVYTIGEDKLSSDLQPITDEVNNKYVKLELDRRFNANDPNRFYYRSDHYNFAKKGVPIIFYFNGTHADYHRPSDTVDKINFDLMAKRVHLVFHTAWVMANRNNMLRRDIPLN